MTTALRYEVRRLRTLRSTWLLLAAAIAATGLIAYLVAVNLEDPTVTAREFARIVPATGVVLPLIAMVLGALAMGQEHRRRTLDVAVAGLPRRLPLLYGKAGVVAVTAALLTVLASETAALIGAVVLGDRVPAGHLLEPALAASVGKLALLTALYALLGLAVATVVSNLPAALVGLVAVPWLVEPFAALAMRTDQARWLPFLAGQQVVRHDEGLLSPLAGGLYFAGFVALALILAAVVLKRRDV